jgi:K+-transporting ATPase ATPase A chain
VSAANWIELVSIVVVIFALCPFVGTYVARVYATPGADRDLGRPFGDRVFLAIERPIYRICGIDPEGEQRWTTYAYSLLAFSLVSVVILYAQLRLQGHLIVNPDHYKGVPPALSFNTAVSFLTNTNWQNYGDGVISQFTQMAGLAFHNFVSAASGAAVAVALVRGFTRRKAATLGNFWVDLVRTCVRILLPLAFVGAVVLGSQGVIQNFHGARTVHTVAGATQVIPGGPVASQEAIKEGGQNGGGFFGANSTHPFENPNPITNWVEILLILLLPFSFPFAFGKLAGDRKQGWVIFAAMFGIWLILAVLAMNFEARGSPLLTRDGTTQTATSTQGGGNMEGKETMVGSGTCGLFAASTTGTSTGAIDCQHDSLTPLGGGVALISIMLGEISPGGTGSGLYGMLIFALLAVFIAGLMVGRTPEYLGKKIQAQEMKLVVLYILFVPMVILVFSGATIIASHILKTDVLNATALTTAHGSTAHSPHGLTEVVYAFTSAANNNGSAFGGLAANTNWFNVTLAISMFVGRFFLMIPVLGIAGSLGQKQLTPATAGTFPTGTTLFAGLLVGVVVIVVGLTFFPVVALGPIVEHLAGHFSI